MGLATVMNVLNGQDVDQWLETTGHQGVFFPDNSSVLVDWMLNSDRKDINGIVRRLWRDVVFPDMIYDKLKYAA